jgi:hypothetical protein
MKKKIFLDFKKLLAAGFVATALFAFAPSAQAQDDMEARFGIKGGANLSTLYIKDINTQKSKFGVHAGIWAKIPVAQFFAVQPELIYTTNGAKVGNYSVKGGPAEQVDLNFNYLQLPILASLTAGPVSIQAGPYISYLLNAKTKNVRVDNNGIPTSSGTARELNRDDFNTIDYGLAGGLALDIKGFQIGARYNYGLRDVGKYAIPSLYPNGSKNSVAQLYVAVGL